MLNKLLFVCILFCNKINVFAQGDFYSRGTIKYEYKVNNHKNFASESDDPEDNVWTQRMIEFTPKFSTYYYSLKFADNKSIFNYTGKEENAKKMWNEDQLEDNIWYTDYNATKFINQKNIFGDIYKLEDSMRNIKWKIEPTETREFIGFNCKKAVGIIYDSVYVFAYYTDAFTIPGGPMNINGLPGVILGITIPRLYISCIATAYSPLVKPEEIIAPKKGKLKPVADLQKKILEATKDWGSYSKKAIWQGFL
jgi:GLPGLI family protein